MSEPRLAGVRTPYAEMPGSVRDWVAAQVGSPVVEVRPRTGGMSPAVAASVRAANGRTAFVKAVSTDIHPVTPTHFRHEIEILQVLPPAPYRAGLQAAYDDGDWVVLLLDDVDGRHPDWDDPADRAAVLDVVHQQTQELIPAPQGLPEASNREAMQRYLDKAGSPTEVELAALPDWARADRDHLLGLLASAVEHQRDDAFCHWDIRHDNIVMRHRDQQPVLVDWGMARRGQRWGDTMCFGLEWVEQPEFDTIMATLDLSAQEEADVTGFVIGLGIYCLMMSTQPPHPSLPHLNTFRRELGSRCLAGVRRRLDLGLT